MRGTFKVTYNFDDEFDEAYEATAIYLNGQDDTRFITARGLSFEMAKRNLIQILQTIPEDEELHL